MAEVLYETPRLIVRRWRESDRDGLAELVGDLEVMRFYPATQTRAESDALFDRLQALWARYDLAFPAVERKEDGAFIGHVGLARIPYATPFSDPAEPMVEIGWRLRRTFWRRGYALEAARAAIDHGFGACGLEEILAFTAAPNAPSAALMRRLGMRRDPAGDFDHPNVPPGHPLRRHVLYRIARADRAQA